MRTKALAGAAVLAAGLVSTMAQVYSLNIVGYANVPIPAGLTYMSNPLDNGANDANTLFPNPDPTQDYSGPYDACQIQEWTGTGWKSSLFDSVTTDTTTGFTTPAGLPTPAPVLGAGKGFLFYNGGTSNLVTFVGQVRTGTNTVSLPIVPTPYSLGSPLPYSGGISTALLMSNPDPAQDYSGPLDSANVQILQLANGQSTGYKAYLFNSVTTDTTTGFTTPAGLPAPEPQIPLGGGFIFVNSGTTAYNWVQVLNP